MNNNNLFIIMILFFYDWCYDCFDALRVGHDHRLRHRCSAAPMTRARCPSPERATPADGPAPGPGRSRRSPFGRAQCA